MTTAVPTKALHAFALDPGEWWACSEPERPGDLHCCYDEKCNACILHLQADATRRGDFVVDNMDDMDSPLLATRVIARFLEQR